jgi:single-strand DNA-binding protein
MYLNKVYLIGNLTRDPELKALPSGTKVASFSVATNRSFRDKEGNRQDQTEFHNIVAFSKLGELAAQYLKKGSQALVEGRIQTRSWDKPDGSKAYRTEIIADNIQFGTRAPGAASGAPSASSPSSSSSSAKGSKPEPKDAAPAGDAIEYPEEDINPDDIPF